VYRSVAQSTPNPIENIWRMVIISEKTTEKVACEFELIAFRLLIRFSAFSRKMFSLHRNTLASLANE
jgi:hypothetical protein